MIAPATWDYCVAHATKRGHELLAQTPDRVSVELELPRFATPLGGISRSEWEAVRILLCGIVLEPERPDV